MSSELQRVSVVSKRRRVGKGALIEIGCCRFRQTLNVPKLGKPDFGTRVPAVVGHAEPVIGPAEGRTRWLYPPLRRFQMTEICSLWPARHSGRC